MLIVLPGRQAGRRLRQILEQRARDRRLRLSAPEIITPADLPEHLYPAHARTASSADSHCAWLRAVQRADERDRQTLMPAAPDSAGPLAGVHLAELAARARTALMAEGLSLTEAAARCAALPGVCDDGRWVALARVEALSLGLLARAGLSDRDDVRRAALRGGGLACRRDIFLIGAVDLSGVERALLCALPTPVTALVPAPPEARDGFDAVGGLLPEFWHDLPLPIPEHRLHFPDSPTAEALAVAAVVMTDGGLSAGGQITLGVGDERDAEGFARRLAARGLPTRSPYGRPLARTRPAVLLHALQDFLADSSARCFAALVRHPDLESWLARLSLTQSGPESGTGGGSLLEALDVFLAGRMPERLPDDLPPPLDAAHRSVQTLLAPLRDTRPLADWAAPLTEILRSVYAAEVDEVTEDAEGRQLRRALSHVTAFTEEMRDAAPALAPRLSGRDALAFLLRRIGQGPRLPDDAREDGLEMRGWLELAWDDAPTLLITGLHEGAAPADPLLPDALRRHLGLPSVWRRQARDAFLLRVILESRPRVHLFAARRGVDGGPRRPSRLLFLCDGEAAARRALRFSEGEGSPAANPGNVGGAGTGGPLFPSGSARRLPPPRPEPLPAPVTRLRVTAFRDYLACPYRFYLRHVLMLGERDDAADEMDAARFGTLLHDCLAALARSPAAESPSPAALQDFLRAELRRQARRQFGEALPAPVRLQVRQAGQRLDRFACWQAEQTAQGWLIQRDFAERDLQAELRVDDAPFTLTGRLDRVDYHPGEDLYRVLDYKTGDAGAGPDSKHRGGAGEDGVRPWQDLQLPLYRRLAEANGVPPDRLEVGYVLLPADLGGSNFAAAAWTGEEFSEADACAEGVIRAIRREVFWPPAGPVRSPDALSPLCLDGCRDRQDWFGDHAPPEFGAGGLP